MCSKYNSNYGLNIQERKKCWQHGKASVSEEYLPLLAYCHLLAVDSNSIVNMKLRHKNYFVGWRGGGSYTL